MAQGCGLSLIKDLLREVEQAEFGVQLSVKKIGLMLFAADL